MWSCHSKLAAPMKKMSDGKSEKGFGHPLTMGERIEARMTELGLNQMQVEKAMGVSRGYLSRIISGQRGKNPSHDYLHSMASILGTTPNYLKHGKTTPEESIITTPKAGLPPRFDEIRGYRQAEFEVVRLEPSIPFHVFERARASRLTSPPTQMEVSYLRDFVKFLAQYPPAPDIDESTLVAKKKARKSDWK